MQKIESKKQFLIGILVLLTIIVIIIGLIILINRHDKEYWESEGSTWKKDCSFFGITNVNSFDPVKLESKDQKLVDTSLELLQSIADNKPFDENYIIIDKDQIDHLNPDGRKYIDSFWVVQKDDKAVVTFRYSVEKTKIEEAMDQCKESYKTYPYDKIFLEKMALNGW